MVALPRDLAEGRRRLDALTARLGATVTPRDVAEVLLEFGSATLFLESFLTSRRWRLEAILPRVPTDDREKLEAWATLMRDFEAALARDRAQAEEVAAKAATLQWTSVTGKHLEVIQSQTRELRQRWVFAELLDGGLRELELLAGPAPSIAGLDSELSEAVHANRRHFGLDLALLSKL